jgi:hypothetical protein
VAGIYTADPDDLSLGATMPRFLELERRERSVILALWRAARRAPQPGTSGARWSLFVTLRDGMSELTDTLAARLPAGAVRIKQRVTGLERRGDGWRVGLAEGPALEADRVVIATESHAAARLLRYSIPRWPPLGDRARVVGDGLAGLPTGDVPHPLDGFGFVAPLFERAIRPARPRAKYLARAQGFADPCLRRRRAGRGQPWRRDDVVARVPGSGRCARILAARSHACTSTPCPARTGSVTSIVETIERRLAAAPGPGRGCRYRGVGIADTVQPRESAAERALST